jgi:hypothetical protein
MEDKAHAKVYWKNLMTNRFMSVDATMPIKLNSRFCWHSPKLHISVSSQEKTAVANESLSLGDILSAICKRITNRPAVIVNNNELLLRANGNLHLNICKTYQNPNAPPAESRRFQRSTFLTFFSRMDPAHNIAKPSCMKKTRAPA